MKLIFLKVRNHEKKYLAKNKIIFTENISELIKAVAHI